jgi:hypothetical protein
MIDYYKISQEYVTCVTMCEKKKTTTKIKMTIHLQLTTIFEQFELGGCDWAHFLCLLVSFRSH